jgi:hypothetical protein
MNDEKRVRLEPLVLVKVASLRSVGQESLANAECQVTCGLFCQFEFKNLTFEKLERSLKSGGLKFVALTNEVFNTLSWGVSIVFSG